MTAAVTDAIVSGMLSSRVDRQAPTTSAAPSTENVVAQEVSHASLHRPQRGGIAAVVSRVGIGVNHRVEIRAVQTV